MGTGASLVQAEQGSAALLGWPALQRCKEPLFTIGYSLLKNSIPLPQRLKPSLIGERLPQRWKRCATQIQSFSANCLAAEVHASQILN